MTEFLAMNGHGVYVWGAYGISLLTLAGIGLWPLLAMRRIVRRLRWRSSARRTSSACTSRDAPSP